MKKMRFIAILLLILFSAVSFTGCTLVVGKEQAYFYERPAFGFTVEDEVVTEVDLQKQFMVSLTAKDGVIKVTPYDGDSLRIIESRKLTGPLSKNRLKEMLEAIHLQIEKGSIEVEISNEPDEKQKPFFRMTDDIELKVPKSLSTLEFTANSGKIIATEFRGLNKLSLTISKGSLEVDGCEANLLYTTITNGNLDVNGFTGTGSYKNGRGNIRLQDIKGDIELESLSGDTVIQKAEGKLNCEISTGSLTVGSSQMGRDSILYASSGNIDADMTDLEPSGKYSIKASKGDIKVKLSETAGWSLLSESTKGSIINNLKSNADELKKAPSCEFYGDVHGGGPTVDVYVDMGDIILY